MLPEARLNDLANGVARVLIEKHRLILLRLKDPLAPHTIVDELFRHDVEHVNDADYGTKFKGPFLDEAIHTFLESHKPVWKLKTYKARVWQLGYLVEYLGSGRPLASIKTEHIRSYRNAVLTLRAKHGLQATQTFATKQATMQPASGQKRPTLFFSPCVHFSVGLYLRKG